MRPSDAYMRQWNGSSLIQVMVCRLFSAKNYQKQCWSVVIWDNKSLPEPTMIQFSDAYMYHCTSMWSLIARFMGPTWGPSGTDRTQVGLHVGPMNFAIWNVADWRTNSLSRTPCLITRALVHVYDNKIPPLLTVNNHMTYRLPIYNSGLFTVK